MLIKEADNRQRDIDELNALLALPHISEATKQKIQQEIRKIQSGIKGENEAAFQINFFYENAKNWAVIHDLRLEFEGYAVQIDHLLIDRLMEVYVCESKRFSEGIGINEHGEFFAFSQGKPYAIPSPIEQNNRYKLLLQRLFDNYEIELPTRLGFKMKPSLHSLILIANTSSIRRPKNGKNVKDLDRIIKVEQIIKRIDKDTNEISALSAVTGVAKMISSDTLQEFAEQLANLHTPIKTDWKTRFGTNDRQPETPQPLQAAPIRQPENPISQPLNPTKQPLRLFCADCKKTVTPKVANFCWNNKTRFQGRVYCYDCQRNHP